MAARLSIAKALGQRPHCAALSLMAVARKIPLGECIRLNSATTVAGYNSSITGLNQQAAGD